MPVAGFQATNDEAIERNIDPEKDLSPLQFSNHIAGEDFLAAYTAKHPLPTIRGPIWLAKFRFSWFTVYRRLFALVLTANVVSIIILICNDLETTYNRAAVGLSSNIFAAVLARHDNLINAVISVVHVIPPRWSISVRKRMGKIYCHAGIHSGCGVSAAVWYVYYMVLLVLQPVYGPNSIIIPIYLVTALTLICLVIMIGMSHPAIRKRWHDLWEQSHRYIGWLLTALIWTQVFLLCSLSDRALGEALLRSPPFWLVLGVTCLLIHPWAALRRRAFVAKQLSNHALRLEFDYARPRTGHSIRLAKSRLGDWHGFATIPNANDSTGFSVIISHAGDWTREIITSANRRTHLWVRGRLFLGVMEVLGMFSPLVLAATGSGIAPCMAFTQTHPHWRVRIVWSARSPETTYGPEIIATILKADPDAIIIDTNMTGRPDMKALIYAAYKEVQAEAVLFVSNVNNTEQVSYELEARGVPVYVPIFDS
ncbi:hypothetical protein Q7P37_005208 [Cladosporium fusiforme]